MEKKKNLFEAFMGTFGLDINKTRNKTLDKNLPEFSAPSSDDGEILVDSSTTGFGSFMSQDISVDPRVTSESELINQYRQLALHAEPDQAIQEIVNEAIVIEEDKPPVEINLDNIDRTVLPESTKKEIIEEFENVLALLKFREKGTDIFTRWYIDSRLVYHKMIDTNNKKKGIQKLKFLDPRKIRKVKEVEQVQQADGSLRYNTIEEYFLYFEAPFQYDQKFGGSTNVTINRLNMSNAFQQNYSLKIFKDSICYATSGLVDPSTGVCYGYLQKAVRPFNMLKWAEDSMMIRRVANSGEKLAISVDVGKMNAKTADRYMNGIINNYKNTKTYNANSGELNTDARVMSVQDIFWLPKFADGKGSDVQTIGTNPDFDDTGDVEYYRTKLYNSLRVPSSRFEKDAASVVLGGNTEISRDELKFTKFINELRTSFSHVFSDILKTQLILKGILAEDEWEEIETEIRYDFLQDSYYTEAKEQELLMARIDTVEKVKPLAGLFYSYRDIRKNILKQTDEDIKRMKKEIEEEKKDPLYKVFYAEMEGGEDEEGESSSSSSGSSDYKLPKIGD